MKEIDYSALNEMLGNINEQMELNNAEIIKSKMPEFANTNLERLRVVEDEQGCVDDEKYEVHFLFPKGKYYLITATNYGYNYDDDQYVYMETNMDKDEIPDSVKAFADNLIKYQYSACSMIYDFIRDNELQTKLYICDKQPL
jgi:hypothetical protein